MEDASPSAPFYLWFDAEFSDLDLDRARFLQVSLVATDTALRRLRPPQEDLNLYLQLEDEASLSPWVCENIPDVLAACRSDRAVPASELDARLSAYVDQAVGPAAASVSDRPLIAGNSVHNDWVLARRLLPEFIARTHYRLLDVSVLKGQWLDWYGGEAFDKDDPDLIRRYFRDAILQEGIRAHDAYYDVQASIAELAFLRDKLRPLTY